jgi:hypothetical protein
MKSASVSGAVRDVKDMHPFRLEWPSGTGMMSDAPESSAGSPTSKVQSDGHRGGRVMTLGEQLQAIRDKSRERIPAESRLVMERAVDDLRRSGALEHVVKVGQHAPHFTLPTAGGRPVALAELLGRGPVVLSFFRGRW